MMPLFLKWLRQQPMGPDFPHSLPDFVYEAELRTPAVGLDNLHGYMVTSTR